MHPELEGSLSAVKGMHRAPEARGSRLDANPSAFETKGFYQIRTDHVYIGATQQWRCLPPPHMLNYFQHLLHFGPEHGAQAWSEGDGSFASLGTAALLVAVAIWRRGPRD